MRLWTEVRRWSWWGGLAFALFAAWAGSRLEILHFDDRPERVWGLILTTAETLGILLTIAARLRGADLGGDEGWPDALRASRAGGVGLLSAETAAAAGAGWAAAAGCAALLLVLPMDSGPRPLALGSWAAAVFLELALIAAWLALASTWLGRLPGLSVAVAVLWMGRVGFGGPTLALWPSAAPVPPEAMLPAAAVAGFAAIVGVTALTCAGRPSARTFD